MLEALRGGACLGALPVSRPAAWALLAGLLGPLLGLQRVFGEDPRVSTALLKLGAATVEHHVAYLNVRGGGRCRFPDLPTRFPSWS